MDYQVSRACLPDRYNCVHTVTQEYIINMDYQVSHCLPDRYNCVHTVTEEYFINMDYQVSRACLPDRYNCVHTVTEEYIINMDYQVSHCLPNRYNAPFRNISNSTHCGRFALIL